MDGFCQGIAGALLATVLCIALSRQSKDMALLLGLAVSAMIFLLSGRYLQPVLEFLRSLQDLGDVDSQWVQLMLKAVGIGLTGQIAALLCADSGNSALAKSIEILTAGAILWLSLPLMTALMELIQKILGEL